MKYDEQKSLAALTSIQKKMEGRGIQPFTRRPDDQPINSSMGGPWVRLLQSLVPHRPLRTDDGCLADFSRQEIFEVRCTRFPNENKGPMASCSVAQVAARSNLPTRVSGQEGEGSFCPWVCYIFYYWFIFNFIYKKIHVNLLKSQEGRRQETMMIVSERRFLRPKLPMLTKRETNASFSPIGYSRRKKIQ